MRNRFHLAAAAGHREAGVSLLELCIVVAVMLVVAASAIPTLLTAVQHYRLRTAARDVAAMLQASRMRCVRDNRHYTLREEQVTQAGMTYSRLFLDQNANDAYDGGEPVMQLPGGVLFNDAAAPALSAATLGYTPQPAATPLAFNGMGLPCVMRNAICSNWDTTGNAVGGVYFLQDTRATSASWAAVSVSPAGRARSWQWVAGNSQWIAQ